MVDKKLRVIIADDEPLARDVLRVFLRKRTGVELLRECINGNEAVEAIRSLRPDLVFLDIQMPDLDGFGVIREIGIETMPAIIFVTAYDRYAIDAFNVHALDYLLKPFDEERLIEALTRATAQIAQEQSALMNERILQLLEEADKQSALEIVKRADEDYLQRVVIKESGRIFFIKVDQIDWIQAAGDYINLHLGRHSHLLHERMNGIECKLDPRKFVRIHRSTIINTDSIKELYAHTNGEYFVYLKDGTKLKLSRNYRSGLQSIFGQAI